jgi:hypothetical protein
MVVVVVVVDIVVVVFTHAQPARAIVYSTTHDRPPPPPSVSHRLVSRFAGVAASRPFAGFTIRDAALFAPLRRAAGGAEQEQ